MNPSFAASVVVHLMNKLNFSTLVFFLCVYQEARKRLSFCLVWYFLICLPVGYCQLCHISGANSCGKRFLIPGFQAHWCVFEVIIAFSSFLIPQLMILKDMLRNVLKTHSRRYRFRLFNDFVSAYFPLPFSV